MKIVVAFMSILLIVSIVSSVKTENIKNQKFNSFSNLSLDLDKKNTSLDLVATNPQVLFEVKNNQEKIYIGSPNDLLSFQFNIESPDESFACQISFRHSKLNRGASVEKYLKQLLNLKSPKNLFTPSSLTENTDCSKRFYSKLINSGVIPKIVFPGSIVIFQIVITDWLKQSTKVPMEISI